jgi:hypothetical protein
MLILFTPSSKNRESFSSVRLSGLASIVNSTDAVENFLKEINNFFSVSISRTVGVPPPMYMVRNLSARESIWLTRAAQ